MDTRKEAETIDVGQPDALAKAFSPEGVAYTLRRIASARDNDNLIAHPLRAAILIEFEEHLSEMLSGLVTAGRWSPSASYLCFTNKRSGNYRELVFPSLIDSIVGRRAIDVLEPMITADDDGRAFCGRSHASSNRQPGDYSNWFQTWLDFTAEIARAAKGEKLAYVYDTDVADFFPSIDRDRAKQFLAQRTGAHRSLIELIFYCLETWLPRFNYMAMKGLPIEPNDVSRLVAHNYLKTIDAEFPNGDDCKYLRYVDDCTIFTQTLEEANDVRRRHHMNLRSIGLNPNAAKSAIMSVDEYQELRQRETNLRVERLDQSKEETGFDALVAEWHLPQNTKRENWDRVTKRLYGTARKHRWLGLKQYVAADLQAVPQITGTIIEYLLQMENGDDELDVILRLWSREEENTERLIHIARYLCDGSFSPEKSKRISDFAVGRVIEQDERPGAGYAKGLLLLAINKHGLRSHRNKILEWAKVDVLRDEQLRLHFLYVFTCRGGLDEALQRTLVSLVSSDIDLLLRLCALAESKKVKRTPKILNRYVRTRGNHRTVTARVLPLLIALARSRNEGVQDWLGYILQPRGRNPRPLGDLVLHSLLEKLHREMIS